MINRLKKMAEERDLNIVYCELPDGVYSGYLERDNTKIIFIDENVMETDLEIESIAQGLAYKMALDELGVVVNTFNDKHTDNVNKVEEISIKYKEEILTEAALAGLHELMKDMTKEEKQQLLDEIVDEIVRNPERYEVKRLEVVKAV